MNANQATPACEFIDVTIPIPFGNIVGRWYGNRKVRPILALHGWLDNMGTWNNLIPLLPKHVGILCIDLPGHGLSSKLPKGIVYHSVDFVCVVLRIIDAYKWPKISILAHSLSAIHTFIFAALCPDRIDMFISIDIVRSRYRKPAAQIELLRQNYEKFLIEDERFGKLADAEPPSYTYEELVHVMHEGSNKSVLKENCGHLLERNIARSTQYPEKYYFSRDGRVKWYIEFTTSPEFVKELAHRICNVPYCVIKGKDSDFINEECNSVIEILQKTNPQFEMHEIQGTHHVHLNNAADVAAAINPFINKHRPPLLETWTVDDVPDGKNNENRNANNGVDGNGTEMGSGSGSGCDSVTDTGSDSGHAKNNTKNQSRWNMKRRKRKSKL